MAVARRNGVFGGVAGVYGWSEWVRFVPAGRVKVAGRSAKRLELWRLCAAAAMLVPMPVPSPVCGRLRGRAGDTTLAAGEGSRKIEATLVALRGRRCRCRRSMIWYGLEAQEWGRTVGEAG